MPAQDMEAFLTGQQDTTSCLPIGLTLDAAAAMFEPPAKRLRTEDGSLAGGSPDSWRALRGWTRPFALCIMQLRILLFCRWLWSRTLSGCGHLADASGIPAFFLIWASLAAIRDLNS